MLSDHALSRALARAGLRAPVRFEEVTPSTQTLALAMAADGAPEWTLVAAERQTAGRGRLGRVWHDRPGASLLFSLVLRPTIAPADAGSITLLAGVALVETVEEVGDQRAACRWPNDVLIGGRKAAGILAESVLSPGGDAFEHVVLGIGANLGEPPAEERDAGAIDATEDQVLEGFLRAFSRRYQPAHPSFAASVLAAYRERCATLGEHVRATTTDGGEVEGVAVDIEPDGGLVIERDGERAAVRFGDVEHLAQRGG